MDVFAHSMWSLILLPGPPSVEKVVLGIAPDVLVFATSLTKQAIKGKMQPGFKTRKEMMDWYHQPENKWVLNFYKWTHSLVAWTALLIPIFFIWYKLTGNVPWFLVAAPLHILMDIPTHNNNSFPVQFLTPISKFKLNGMHWSKPIVFIGNYVLIIAAIYFRMFVIGQ
jgi:hypothetical protein